MSSSEDDAETSIHQNQASDSSSDEAPSHTAKRKQASSGSKVKKKKSRASFVNQFIEDEADDDEDSEEDDEGEEGFGNEEAYARNEEDEAARLEYDETQQRYNQEREVLEAESAEDIVNRIKRRHKQNQRRYDDDDADGESSQHHSHVTQQSLLPSVKDPKMWIFKCKPGREQPMVLALMNKFIDFTNKGTPLGIISVVSSSKGFIYVEAEREPHAKTAIQGLRDIVPWSMKLVPIQEMSSVLTITSMKKPIVAGVWARIKRVGTYKGDLCKVLEVMDSSTRALVKLVPRLDLAALTSGIPTKMLKGQRNSASLLTAGIMQTLDVHRKRHPITNEMVDLIDGEYFQDGFILKEYNILSTLTTENVIPMLEEKQKFDSASSASRDHEANLPGASDAQAGGNWIQNEVELAKGDTVRVMEGDLLNLMGIVVAISASDDTVKVMPLHEEIKDTILDFNRKQLMKFIKVGDHIKVISGRYIGETGTVVSINEETNAAPIAIVLADSMAKEIQVRVRDVQESAEVSTGLDSLKGKQLYDMVALAHGDVGVITHVGRENFKIICQNGQTREVTDQEIQRVLQSGRSAALDKEKNHITPGEMVSVVEGTYQGQTGTIKHLYRSCVFLHNNKMTSDSGIFVCKSRQLVLAGSKAKSTLTANSLVNPTQTRAQQQRGPPRAGGPNASFADRQKSNDMVGKTVKIKRGLYKGYLGMIVDESEHKVKIEIHSKHITTEVDKAHIIIAGTRTGQIMDHPRTNATPLVGATPMGQTPLAGSMTPMNAMGTPMHPSSGNATPMQSYTPAGDAWQLGSKTPLMDSSTPHDNGSHTSHSSSSTLPYNPVTYTPMEMSGTPHAQDNMATTPGMYNPHTPGGLGYSPAPGGLMGSGMMGTPGAGTPGAGLYPNTPSMIGTPGGLMGPGGSLGTPSMAVGTPMGQMLQSPYTDPTSLSHSSRLDSTSSHASATSGGLGASGDFSIDMEVRVTDESSDWHGSTCVVQSIDAKSRHVHVRNGPVTRVFPASALVHVVPEKHHRIKILSGEDAGQMGLLIGTDGDDGIVKMDVNSEILIFNLASLAKMHA